MGMEPAWKQYLIGAALGALVLGVLGGAVLVGMGLNGGGGESESAVPSDEPTAQQEPSTVTPAPEPEPLPETPDPQIEDSLTCDYLLGEGISSDDYRFVAGGTVSNIGNVGTIVRVRATWKLLGERPKQVSRKFRVKRNQDRDWQITVPATQNEIDAHQSADGECDTSAKVLDTFGKAGLD